MAKSNTKKKSNPGLIATVIVVVLIIVGVAYILGKYNNSLYSPNGYTTTNTTPSIPIPQIYTLSLLSQGQVFSINAGGRDFVNFTIPSGSYSINVSGSYTSQGKVEVAILTPAQYGAFTQNEDSITSSQYYYGDTQGSTINAQLSTGQYTLVFYDPGLITQDTVSVVNPIVVHYTN